MAFDQATRKRLQDFVEDARKLLSDEFTQQLQNTYGLDPATGGVAALSDLPVLSPSEQQTAQLLRDTLEHYLAASHKADPHKDKALVIAALDRIVREQAFTVLNRLAALRMAEARQFVMESISEGYQSKGFQLYQRIAGSSLGERGQAYRHYLFSVFDELSLDLAVLFDRYSSQGRLFPSETVLLELLDLINHDDMELLWVEDETVGWIYQYFNSKEERRKMRDESQAPRNSRELAVRNQFFTPRYVVEFLTDNTLGRIWYEMTQGKTALVDSCQYLVQRPNEVFLKSGEVSPEHTEQNSTELSQDELLQQTVYVQHRPIKDPRDIKMLDPACGSMHFGLYAFDLFERIYSEAWDIEADKGREIFFIEEGAVPKEALHEAYPSRVHFLADVPRLIIEHNIHGVDIDPRAAQIAGLSLWLRAQKSWSANDIKPDDRPQIQRSNIVCAEPMPGERQLLKEFTSQIQPRVLGQLVEDIFEKMQLAGEAGTLLKIEEEIKTAIDDAKSQKDQNILEVQGGLFGDNKWEVREGKRYYNFGDVGEGFWEQAEQLILSNLERYAETAVGLDSGQKRLFAADAVKGFAYIDLCRKRYDVVLMNPPFGEVTSSSGKYLEKNYPLWSKNILCAFFIRSSILTRDDSLMGVIFDRTAAVKSSYEAFREKYMSSNIFACLDTGWGTLDANVETTCIVVKNELNNLDAPFIDLRDILPEKKQSFIQRIATSMSENTHVKWMCPKKFLNLPNKVMGYDFPFFALDAFGSFNSLQSMGLQAKQGHALVSDVHFRQFWEMPCDAGSRGKYRLLYNGGKFSPYYIPPSEVVYGKSIKGLWRSNKSVVLRNLDQQGKPGIGYGKRGDYLDVHPLRSESIFTSEGQAIPDISINEALFGIAYLNSTIARYLINLYCGQHKHAGYINLLPCPAFCNDEIQELARLAEKLLKIAKELNSLDECSLIFSGLDGIKEANSLDEVAIEYLRSVEEKSNEIVELDEAINKIITSKYTISFKEMNIIEKFKNKIQGYDFSSLANIGKSLDEVKDSIVSYLVGAVFGRWGIDVISSPATDLFSPIDLTSVFIDVNEKKILTNEELFSELEGFVTFDISEFGPDYFAEINKFFDKHLIRYSCRRQSPIYWPLQTMSGSYTLWISYQQLDEQTLYTCVNEFVQPKINEMQEELDILRNISGRKIQDEKKLTSLSGMVSELEDFKDEILRIAKFWKPDLNDGVQITAAPLWKLFQHKAWQKKLKKTWECLEKGSFDWAHLAFSIWPKRVLQKCHQDRSIAIAHGVDSDLWKEIEVPASRGKGTKLVWQPKKMNEAELDLYIENKIAKDRSLP